MIRVGVIGLGMMGSTHLDVYSKRSDVTVLAISDIDPERLAGKDKAQGNIEGQAQGGADLSAVRRYDEGMKLIADPDVELVDICLPTPLHADYAIAALNAGKHVLVEKPFARTARDADRLVAAAQRCRRTLMCAMCMRFWPGWTWLKERVADQAYGKVCAAHFRRVSSHPGKSFYNDGQQCGGAILDLHIHDVDYVQYAFGRPKAVTSFGYRKVTSAIDHVVTRFDFGPRGPMVVAEGGWAMAPGFGFSMQYTVNFTHATAVFDLAASDRLTLIRNGKKEPVQLEAGMGYEHEIDYLLRCLAGGQKPSIITPRQAADAVRIVEAEVKSIQRGRKVSLTY